MDWLQFFSSLVGSIVWPATAAWTIYLMKAPIARAITAITKVKAGGVEVDIGSQLDAVENQVDAATGDGHPSVEAPSLGFQDLARIDPRAAILSAWLPVQTELTEIARAAGLPENFQLRAQLEALHKRGVIDRLTFETLNDLRVIRNTAIHMTEESVSYEDALRMDTMCIWVKEQLQRINASM